MRDSYQFDLENTLFIYFFKQLHFYKPKKKERKTKEIKPKIKLKGLAEDSG